MRKFFLILAISVLVGRAVPVVFAGEGHDAGYEWAERYDIRDTDYSNGNSESFNEGVRQYAEEQAENQSDEEEQ